MNNIAFDFDGVICESYNIFRGHFWDMFGHAIAKEADHHVYEMTLSEDPMYEPWWWREIPVAIAKYQHICPPVNGSLVALHKISRDFHGVPIQIITAREPSDAVKQVTYLWCDLNFTFDYEITFCSTSEDKLAIMKEKNIEYYVDDRFKTAVELAPIMKRSYLFNAPWNIRDDKLPANVKRIDSLWEMRADLNYRILA